MGYDEEAPYDYQSQDEPLPEGVDPAVEKKIEEAAKELDEMDDLLPKGMKEKAENQDPLRKAHTWMTLYLSFDNDTKRVEEYFKELKNFEPIMKKIREGKEVTKKKKKKKKKKVLCVDT